MIPPSPSTKSIHHDPVQLLVQELVLDNATQYKVAFLPLSTRTCAPVFSGPFPQVLYPHMQSVLGFRARDGVLKYY